MQARALFHRRIHSNPGVDRVNYHARLAGPRYAGQQIGSVTMSSAANRVPVHPARAYTEFPPHSPGAECELAAESLLDFACIQGYAVKFLPAGFVQHCRCIAPSFENGHVIHAVTLPRTCVTRQIIIRTIMMIA
mgnify:CR=1 FL=1